MTGKISTAILLLFLLMACSTEKSPLSRPKNLLLKPHNMEIELHFTGTIQPIHESTISTPVEAVVETIYFHYGQPVRKGDVIMVLNSAELQKQYNEVITEYLKAKDGYYLAKAKFSGTEDLWHAGLLPKNNYLHEKSSLDNSHITLLQATRKLTEMGEKMQDNSLQKISRLTLAEFEKISQALEKGHNLIQLRAPGDGILLYPPQSGDDKTKRVVVGSSLKTGQVVGLVGDLRGLKVEIEIPEVDIHKIYTGMPAFIQGVAFGGQILQGKIIAINAQASHSSGSALPAFNAIIEIQNINEEQQRWVKVGMSATIILRMTLPNKLLIPIAALTQQEGKSMVTVRLPDGSLQNREITTGQAKIDQVLVTSGLQAGEMLVYG